LGRDWWGRRRIGWKCSETGRWKSEAYCPSNQRWSSGGITVAVDGGDGPEPEPEKRTVGVATGWRGGRRSGSMTVAELVAVVAGAGAAASAEDGGSESR